MRIEVVAGSREMFGADRSAIRLAALLDELGHEADVVLPAARPELGIERLAAAAGVRVREGPVLVASSRGLDGLRAGRRDPRPPAAELTVYNSAAVVGLAGDRRPRALVLREWIFPRWLRHRLLCAAHARRVDRVIATSAGVADRWRRCAGDSVAVEVCPNWIEQRWLQPNAGPRAGVLFAGRLNAWKGHETLAAAFDRAFSGSDSPPPLTFLGAEDPPSPFHAAGVEFGRLCERRGWTLLSFLADPLPTFRGAALVVVPSLRPEPFGNVILEGLASGARVIAFPGGGVDDLAPRFPGALEVVDRDPGALAAALWRWDRAGRLAQSPEEHGRTMATLEERFSAAAAAPRWQRIVESLVADGGSP